MRFQKKNQLAFMERDRIKVMSKRICKSITIQNAVKKRE
jgi:hypothetical protein